MLGRRKNPLKRILQFSRITGKMTTISNRITKLFEQKSQNILTLYFTAGYPALSDTHRILEAIEIAGADIVEIGMPFSDSVVDGSTIQNSNQKALDNGMSIQVLFEQIANFREKVQIPALLMGYLNPVIQFGMEKFCKQAAEVGIDGFILPDLPLHEYLQDYKSLFDTYNLSNIFLITPETSEERIRAIDKNSQGFIYVVSKSSTTGKTEELSENQLAYFQRIKSMNLDNPLQIGIGISDKESFQQACQHAPGAIIGSAFIRALEAGTNLENSVNQFIKGIIE